MKPHVTRDTAADALSQSLRWMRRAQNSDYGLPTDDLGSRSTTWPTAGLLWAANDAGAHMSQWARRGLSWLADHSNDDGGIPICDVGDPSIVDATAQAVLAYALSGATESPAALRAVTWLIEARQPSSGWQWRPAIDGPLTISTAFATRALATARAKGIRVSDLDAAIADGIEWLIEAQNDDGGWGPKDGDLTRPAPTAHAAIALKSSGYLRSSEDVCNLLVKASKRGHWPDTIDRPGGHTVIRWADACCTEALCRLCDAALETHCERSIKALLESHTDGHFQYGDTTMHSWPTRDGILALSAYLQRDLPTPSHLPCQTSPQSD